MAWRGKWRWLAGGAALLALLVIGRLSFTSAPPGVHSATRLQMGTLVTISVWGVADGAAERAMEPAFEEIARIESLMSRFLASSPLARLNEAPRGRTHPVPGELAQLMARGVEFGRLSRGAFDIGLGPLSDLWGFSREPPPTAPPSREALQNWRSRRSALQGEQGIEITPEGVNLANDAVGVDPGGIAKGYAVDQAMEKLRQAGVENALINAGGDMRIAGSKGGKPWHIGLRDPRNPDGVVAVMDLVGPKALSTSGDYERFFLADGVRHHHILDPRSGESARSGLISVSIQAPDSLTADALSTALFVLGEQAGLALLRLFPGCEAFLIREDLSFVQTEGFIAVRSKAP
ncbi:MAG: FAD:protein FMN transferase [Magnetococcales bacterium]|nr:FAD:protein FMN transferase [Magnetococcales bacterium]